MNDTELPVRAGTILPFTPECAKDRDPKPVYKLRVPSLSDRHAIDRDVVSRGASFPDFGVSMAKMRAGIAAVLPENRRDEALAVVLDFETLSMERNDGPEFIAAYLAYSRLESELQRLYVPVATQVAQGRYYNATAQLLALQHLLVGWSKVEGEFAREDGLTTEATLAQIPEDEYAEVANKALSLIRLSQAKSKKSAPPASSASSPTNTQAALTTTAPSGPDTGAGPIPST